MRLRWGFLDETLGVDWSVPGDPSVYETLTACQADQFPLDIVTGSAPGWTDPWSRARRARIVSLNFLGILVEGDGQRWEIPRYDIQAVRPANETPDDTRQAW